MAQIKMEGKGKKIKWRADFYILDHTTGKRKRVRKDGFNTKKEAEALDEVLKPINELKALLEQEINSSNSDQIKRELFIVMETIIILCKSLEDCK